MYKNTNLNSNIKKTSQCDYSSDGKSFAIFSERTIDFFIKKNNLDINDIYVQSMLTNCEKQKKRIKIDKGEENDKNDKGEENDKDEKSDCMDIDIETDYMDVDIEME